MMNLADLHAPVLMFWHGRPLCKWSHDSLTFTDGHCHREHAVVFVRWASAAARAMEMTA